MKKNNLRILIVEDDPLTAMLLEQLITEEGHTVVATATNSKETLHAIKKDKYDLVFMDLHLKDGANGLDLTRHIIREAKLPVIIISGSQEEEILEGVSESGALSFLQKPVNIVPLRMNLRIAMHHHTLQTSLAESEQRYRAIYNNAAMGIYISHPDGYYLTCNQAFASILGYAGPQELMATLRSQDEQLYDDPDRRRLLLALLQEQGEVCNFESRVFGRDGDMLWISECCTPILSADGELVHYEGIVSDVTARKDAEDAFRTAYNLIRTTIDSLQDGVIVTDLGGHLVIANSAARGMTTSPLKEGERLDFLDPGGADSPFGRFLKDFAPQSGGITLNPKAGQIQCSITPYKNADNVIIGAVHVLSSASS